MSVKYLQIRIVITKKKKARTNSTTTIMVWRTRLEGPVHTKLPGKRYPIKEEKKFPMNFKFLKRQSISIFNVEMLKAWVYYFVPSTFSFQVRSHHLSSSFSSSLQGRLWSADLYCSGSSASVCKVSILSSFLQYHLIFSNVLLLFFYGFIRCLCCTLLLQLYFDFGQMIHNNTLPNILREKKKLDWVKNWK